MIRTLVSAASPLARGGLAAVVRGDERFELVGEASPRELEAGIATFDPDVLLEQRDAEGEVPPLPSVTLVDDPREAWLHAVLAGDERGAFAILARDASRDEIAAALVAVAAGLVALQPRALVTAPPGIPHEPRYERLTAREIEVLGELARGAANKAIAAHLDISEHTVKFHVASIFAKLAVSSRTEAVTQGIRSGLIML